MLIFLLIMLGFLTSFLFFRLADKGSAHDRLCVNCEFKDENSAGTFICRYQESTHENVDLVTGKQRIDIERSCMEERSMLTEASLFHCGYYGTHYKRRKS